MLVLDEGGDLHDELEQLGSVVVAGSLAPHDVGPTLPHRVRLARGHRRLREQLEELGPIDVSHVHCAGSMRAFPALPSSSVLCHLHELDVGLDLHLGPVARQHLTSADRYVAVSEGVRSAFLARFDVDPAAVDRQWGFVDEARLPQGRDRSVLGEGFDGRSFVVVSAGVRHWRKAPELFVRTAMVASRLAPQIDWRFVWIGGADAGGLEDLVRAAGLQHVVTFLPHQPDPLPLVAAADAFFLPAREDAFPLVCVEAAAIGRPIVTFDNGGAAELVRKARCGTVVELPDVAGAAEALLALAEGPVEAAALGGNARRFAREHLLLEHAGPALAASIEHVRRSKR